MRVLVVDDDPDVLQLVGEMLRAGGHEAVTTSAPADAAKRMETSAFDALVTDVLMPEIDGIELMRAVRQRSPRTWVVAISGGGDRFPANAALKLIEVFGANRVLYKPFSADELLFALEAGATDHARP